MSAYFDLILLFVAVVLIFTRLRNVLGTRPDDDKPKVLVVKQIVPNENLQEQLQETIASVGEPLSEIDKKLYAIPQFSRQDFCARCAKVFEMVLNAFASADESTLKMLVGKKLFDGFQEIIKQRKAEGITAETDLIKIDDLCIEDVKISSKGVAQIVVKFISEQINLLKNAAGEVIEGDENFVQKITDVWTFERNINSESPVWFLVSTKKAQKN